MALTYFCICMRTVTRNTYHVLYIGTTFGSNARICTICVRLEKFQFLEKWKNRNFGYKIVISVNKSRIYSLDLG